MLRYTKSSLVRTIKHHAARMKGPITLMGFCNAERISPGVIPRCFPKGFGALVAAAGLQHRRSLKAGITDDALLADLHRVARIIGHLPGDSDLFRLGRFCRVTYYHRWGPIERIRAAYRRWCKANKQRPYPPILRGQRIRLGLSSRPYRPGSSLWLGDPLGFRGLQNTPTNELGVIHLFGLLGPETGIAVEHIGNAFPDCRALRRDQAGAWRPITLEFEFQSSSFKTHGHDASKCNLIVCWDHDWPDCPIEVMELKSMLAKLTGRPAESHTPRDLRRGTATSPPMRRHSRRRVRRAPRRNLPSRTIGKTRP